MASTSPPAMTEELLMALGWCITSKNGRVVEVEPPEDGTCLPCLACLVSLLLLSVYPTVPTCLLT